MNRSRAFSQTCPSCNGMDIKPVTHCSRCVLDREQEQGIESSEGPLSEPEDDRLKILQFTLKPLGMLLAFLGIPLCFLFGLGLSDRRRLQLFGGVAILIMLIGRFGVGPQLAGAAVIVAVALGCVEMTV